MWRAEKQKSKEHKVNAERIGTIFLPYVVESLDSVAPQKFAEDQEEIEDRDDFLAALKLEIAIAVQFGCWKMTTLGIQQSKVTKFSPNLNPKIDNFLQTLAFMLVVNKNSNMNLTKKKNESKDMKEKEEEKKKHEQTKLSSLSFSSFTASSPYYSFSSTSSQFPFPFLLPFSPVRF